MPSIYWYICLAIIGVVSASYAIYIKRNNYKISTLLVFYLFAASLAWNGEFLVLGVFNSYAYKTGVFTDIWAQNLLGHLILNTSLYPAAAVIMVAFSFHYGWMLFVAGFFTFLEYLFIHLNIYEHHWWKTYMTTIIVVVILYIDDKWFAKIKRGCYGLKRAVTYYFVAMLIVHLPAPVLLLLGKQYYEISFVNKMVGNLNLSSIIIIFSFDLIEAFLLVLFTCVFKKWYFKIAPFIISIASQTIFAKMGILVMEDGWKLLYTLIIYEFFIAIFIVVEKYTLIPNPKYLPDNQ